MKRSEQINELAAALATAQGQMKRALKDSENPFFQSKYADLASVWAACREPLSSNALSVVQSAKTSTPDGVMVDAVVVTTLLMHTSGQWIENELAMVPKDSSPQAVGSAISYARRYALAAMVGVYQDDDDAQKAQPLPADKVAEFSEPLVPTGLDAVIKALKNEKADEMRKAWNDAMGLGNADAVWKHLNTAQKKTARVLLNLTAPKEEGEQAS
jgi:hypothetical protein